MPLLEKHEALRIGPDMCSRLGGSGSRVTIAAIERFGIGGSPVPGRLGGLPHRRAGGRISACPRIPLAMNMSWHTQPRLVNLIGPARAKKLVIFGERVAAAQASDWGLVDVVTEDGGALAAARVWADKVAALPPIGVRMAKRAITQIATALNPAVTFMDGDPGICWPPARQDHRRGPVRPSATSARRSSPGRWRLAMKGRCALRLKSGPTTRSIHGPHRPRLPDEEQLHPQADAGPVGLLVPDHPRPAVRRQADGLSAVVRPGRDRRPLSAGLRLL